MCKQVLGVYMHPVRCRIDRCTHVIPNVPLFRTRKIKKGSLIQQLNEVSKIKIVESDMSDIWLQLDVRAKIDFIA